MRSGYLKYCLIEKYLTGVFKGVYKISTQCFNRFIEDRGDLSVYSHLLVPGSWQFLELLCFTILKNDSSLIPKIK